MSYPSIYLSHICAILFHRGLPGAQVATPLRTQDAIADTTPSQAELITLLNPTARSTMSEAPINGHSGISSSSSSYTSPEVSASKESFLNLSTSNPLSTFTTLQAKDMSRPNDQERTATPPSVSPVFQQQEMPSSTVEERKRSRNSQGIQDMKS